MLTGLVTHLGSSAIGGLFVAASLWLRARAKSEESAGEAVRGARVETWARATDNVAAALKGLKRNLVRMRSVLGSRR